MQEPLVNSETDIIIEMRGITKKFGNFKANDSINLKVKRGEIHALLGENGAGKSTLMNILYGLYTPDEGEIYFNGRKVQINSPNDAIDLGIGMIHQHFMLIPVFTVVENMILGRDPEFVLERERAAEKIRELGQKHNLIIDPNTLVEDLTVGQKQRVEILKALYWGAKIIIMDEPTAVLTPPETEVLFETLKQMTQDGFTVIFISHKLNEVMAISDRITVLRQGKVIDTVETSKVNKRELAKMMVGRDIIFDFDISKVETGEAILEIKNLNCFNSEENLEILKNINLSIHKGEIVGLAGVDGNGQSELVEIITGLRKADGGHIILEGHDITTASPVERIYKGMGHIPEDRHERGLILDMPIYENLITAVFSQKPFSKNGLLNWKHVFGFARELIEDFDIRTQDISTPAGNLSGGNQQKVVLARELSRNPKFLVAMHPTRGLDVGAIEYIHKCLLKARERGCGILLVSTELEEILQLSDKIAVIYEGEILKIIDRKDVNMEELGMLMAGSVA